MREYVDIKKHWRKIKPFAESEEGTAIWKKDLEKDYVQFKIYGYDGDNMVDKFYKIFGSQKDRGVYDFNPDMPSDLDACDWRFSNIRGRKPAFWDYVVFRRCHWVVNFNLFLAKKAFPKSDWRIITFNPENDNSHSCVWDGKDLLFDMNFLALVPIEEHPFANEIPKNAKILNIGYELELYISNEDVEMLKSYYDDKTSLDCLEEHFFYDQLYHGEEEEV